MAEEKLLTVRDVATMLGVSEKDVLDLTESGTIPGYKIGGVYLRFKKDQVEQYKKSHAHLHPKINQERSIGSIDRIRDFFYFNDFYIFATVAIFILAYLVYLGL